MISSNIFQFIPSHPPDGNLLEPQLVSPPLKKNYQAAAADGDFVCSTQPLEAFGDRRKKNKDFPRPAAPAQKQAPNNLDFKEGEGGEAAAADASGDSASQDRRDRMRILEYGAFSQPAKVRTRNFFVCIQYRFLAAFSFHLLNAIRDLQVLKFAGFVTMAVLASQLKSNLYLFFRDFICR